jgi:hypothetical protein
MATNDADDAPGERLAADQPKSAAGRRNRSPRLRCDDCGLALDRCGYAFVNVAAAWRRAQLYDQWRAHRIRDGTVINPPPERVTWRFAHPGCHADPDYRRLYVVPVRRLRSDRQLLEVVLRLSHEKWLPHTAWQSSLIRPVLDARRDG